MTRTLMARIHVAAPIDETYRQWAQVEAFPRFIDTVTAVRRIDDVRSRWTISVGGFVDDIYVDVVEQVAPIGWCGRAPTASCTTDAWSSRPRARARG